MDLSVKTAVEAWLNEGSIAESDKNEVRELLASGNEKELTDRFYRELEFGTGGMRGLIGAGLNRMNIYTVGAAAQGLANYVAAQGEQAKKAGVVIAQDSRRMSDAFALRTACVMAGNGITAYLFESLRPTPELSYAVRHLGCAAGVVITASHNPKEYNGFKAYWSDGVQVVPPHDENIIREVRSVGGFGKVRVMEPEQARAKGLLKTAGSEVDEAFLHEVQASCLQPDLCRKHGRNLKIVFTGLHGTGGVLVPEALRRRGFEQVIEVPEQAVPDGEFPTVHSPNPEEGAALNLGIDLARREGADLVIATDPDGDRVGLAVRGPDGDFELLTGNRIAALLTYYICEQRKRNGTLPADAALVTTVVSGGMMKDIARSYGTEVIEVLTGFKWIGQKVGQFEEARRSGRPSRTYIFGAEESYGYMPATFVRDKDAVTSSAYIAEMTAVFAEEGKGLHKVLTDLFQRYGYYQEGAKNITLPGKEGAEKIEALMNTFRTEPPQTLGGIAVVAAADFETGRNHDLHTNKLIEQYDLPASNVMMFTLADGTRVIARPSGTEPKIKFYILTRAPGDDLEKAQAEATGRIAAIVADIENLAR
ncbi:MAG: phospho-sugar mutase [Phycisphaerales bacterium]|nr:phospho-sugar mutase [Phycisphaerales bacterium]